MSRYCTTWECPRKQPMAFSRVFWYNTQIMSRISRFLPAVALLALPMAVSAQFPVPPCPIAVLPCGGGGVEGANLYFWGTMFPILRIAFIGIALVSFVYYAVQLMFARQEESAISEAKSAYEMAIFGCGVVMLTTIIVETFTPGTPDEFIKDAPLRTGLGQVILFLKLALSVVVLMRITIQGVRLILLEGQAEGELDKQKKQFFNGIVGVGAILLANSMVNAVIPGANSAIIGVEMVGLANFLLALAGGLATVAVIVAGFMLILSIDEALKDRAKKTISGAIIALVVILCAYVLVNYFLAL